jgi:cytidylate kinase
MPMIATTREMGSLGRDVTVRLAERMNRKVVYHEMIDPQANKMRVRKSHVMRFLERGAGILERLTADKSSLSIFTADETFRFLRNGETGVLRGWGATHLLRAVPHVVRVRVCAPIELRIRRMMDRLGTDDRATVENEILMNEEAHTAITRRHFGINWRDSEHYDLVLSTERLSVDECVDEIENMTKMPRFQETAESIGVVENLALEWGVRAALKRDPRTSSVSIGVECHDGRVRLLGVVDTQAEADGAAEVAATVERVTSVENELRSTQSAASRSRRQG